MRNTARLPRSASVRHRFPAFLPVLASMFVLILVFLGVLVQLKPPAVVPASAPVTEFSAARALKHIQVIARAPHPTGSPESVQLRQYLFDQLAALGLQPEIQSSASVYHDTGKWGLADPMGMASTPETWSIAGATVHNVMARIPGTDSTGVIVLSAHYDSVPHGPGASDDGAGVAAILETARAIQAGPPLRNDVILLLLDGEEIGLMGSQAFAKEHPWMEDVSLVLNLEARGSSGVSLMYETSLNNSWLIREYAQAAHRPVTSSLATDVWRIMPNSSDLTVFLQAELQGMNFAYTDNWTDYHTSHDSLDDLDLRSVQHHGGNTLALTRHFGGLDLNTRSGNQDAVFFSFLSLAVIFYPKSWALPLMLAAAAGTFLILGWGLRQGKLTLPRLAGGVLAVFIAAGLAALAGFIAVQGLNLLQKKELEVGMGGTYNVHLYEFGLLLIYLAIGGTVYAAFQRRARPAELAAGGLVYWLVLTVVSTLALPGASYLFLWPLLAGLLILEIEMASAQPLSGLRRLLVLIPATIGLILFGTAIYLVQLSFGVGIFPVGGVMTVLLLALIFPYLEFNTLPRTRLWAASLAVAGILVLVWVGVTVKPTAGQPRQNFLFYSMDADASEAAWVAGTNLPDDTLSPWLGSQPRSAFLSEVFPGEWQEQVWINAAPVLDQQAPQLTVLEDTTQGEVRTLRLNLSTPRGAWAVMADITAPGAILEGELYGEKYNREAARDHLYFKIIGLPVEGVEVKIQLRPGVPVTVRLADLSLSLPEMGIQTSRVLSPLRTGFGGGHGIDSMTLIHRRYTLDG